LIVASPMVVAKNGMPICMAFMGAGLAQTNITARLSLTYQIQTQGLRFITPNLIPLLIQQFITMEHRLIFQMGY